MADLREYYRSMSPVNFDLADAEPSDVTYRYFSDYSQEVGKTLTTATVASESLDPKTPMVLIIHGWTSSDSSPWYRPLKDQYLKLGPHSIIYIDWSKAGNKSYQVSSANARPVGRFIAEFLVGSGVCPRNIHVIGHSLGSHLASFIGKSFHDLTGSKLGRITALDPAGPKFEHSLMGFDSRLCQSDADFVDVHHTDIQLFGYTAPVGHVDFYPNEGKHQPGCPNREENDNCSHARSTLYFVESVWTKAKAQEVLYEEEDYEVVISLKPNGKEVVFGQHIDRGSRGVFVINTNPNEPFLND